MKAWLPNFVTLLNLFCGCAAIVCLLDRQFMAAFWFVFAAGWFDFGDGLVARALGVSSEHGKELDSLADMVSFGVFPALAYYVLLLEGNLAPASAPSDITWSWYAAPALLVAMFSALRLAKFNLDTRQTENFLGLSTPASTVFVTGLLLIYARHPTWADYAIAPWVLYPAIGLTCYLLVSEHPMFSFKLKQFGWVGNRRRYIFAALAIGLLFLLGTAAFPPIILAYVLLNLALPPIADAK